MNQLNSLQKGIDYIEANLQNEIEYAEIEKITLMSISQFQKTFQSISGLTLSEYIRRRKLTESALELFSTNTSVLDIALKYGYESGEGFSRAFKEFHTVNPGDVKKGGSNFKIFDKITFEIKINGGNEMKFELAELEDKEFIGIKTAVFADMNTEIDKRWDNDDKNWEATRKEQNELMNNSDEHIWYEIYKKIDNSSYNHYICAKSKTIPDGCESIYFNGGLYAKITTEKCKFPTSQLMDAYYSPLKNTEYLTSAGLKSDDKRNQLFVTNWTKLEKQERYIEIYLPVVKI